MNVCGSKWLALGLVAACSPDSGPKDGSTASHDAPAPAQPEAEVVASAEETPALFGLATRDHEIWMHAGPLYTIKKKDGTVLASQIDQATLERDYPELATDLSSMVDVNERAIGIGGDGVDY